MKRSIHLVLGLMTACTAGLLGFQLYWNYQAYLSATRNFRQDTNSALETAVQQELAQRQQQLVRQYQTWLADTSQVVIGCHVHPLYQTTIFTLADNHPSRVEESAPFDVSFDDFPQKLPSITPQARAFFIRRFATGTIARQLQQGFIMYPTQRLGDRLNEASKQSRPNQKQLRILYAAALKERDIRADFQLSIGKKPPSAAASYGTRTFKTAIMGQPELVTAWFPDPNLVFLDRMKWVLGSSLLLLLVVLGCFGFTVRTLLRQRKLAELKNDFVNNMTHELKTPVATISLATEALQSFDLSPDATADYLTIIRQQSGRLTGLIDQILRSVVLEQAAPGLALRPLDLAEIIAQVLRQNAPQLTQTHAQLTYHPPTTPIRILGDETHLANVLTTLLDNALKYSLLPPQISIRCFTQAGTAGLEVSDNGLGIPAAYQPKVFDKFFRVPTGNLHATKGYGLGLSYAKTIVERHGGQISLRSAEGRGTTFTITLPLAQHELAPPALAGR